MSATLTLQELATAARWQGRNPCIINTGGGVMALSLIVDGAHALVSLDGGQMSGSEWSVSLDSDTRELLGEEESTAPVISDADQTISDAVAWVQVSAHGAEQAFPFDVAILTTKALVVELMREMERANDGAEDAERVDALTAELERRHAGASERLADKVTGWHMGAEDATRWALDWSDCARWVSGELNLTNYADEIICLRCGAPISPRVIGGRRWWFDADGGTCLVGESLGDHQPSAYAV